MPGVGGYLDLGISPEPECEPVSQLHKREEAKPQAKAHQPANLKINCSSISYDLSSLNHQQLNL